MVQIIINVIDEIRGGPRHGKGAKRGVNMGILEIKQRRGEIKEERRNIIERKNTEERRNKEKEEKRRGGIKGRKKR